MKCARKAKASGAAKDSDTTAEGELYFQEAGTSPKSALKFGVVSQATAETPAVPVPAQPMARAESGASLEDLSDRVDEMLERLEGITRTMKLVRWVMWGLGVVTVLSVVVTVGGLLYSMSDQLNPSADGFAVDEVHVGGGGAEGERVGDGRVRDAQIPPQLREKSKPILDYVDKINELQDEANQ